MEAVGGEVRNKYLRGINLIVLQDGSTLYYYLFNLHGDVVYNCGNRQLHNLKKIDFIPLLMRQETCLGLKHLMSMLKIK